MTFYITFGLTKKYLLFSGAIKVSELLDYEVTRSYLLTILATDMGIPPLSNQAMVNIVVLDSNDNAPVFTQQLYAVQVSEDAQVGTTILQVCTPVLKQQ